MRKDAGPPPSGIGCPRSLDPGSSVLSTLRTAKFPTTNPQIRSSGQAISQAKEVDFLSAPPNFLAQRFQNFDSKILGLRILGMKIARTRTGRRASTLRGLSQCSPRPRRSSRPYEARTSSPGTPPRAATEGCARPSASSNQKCNIMFEITRYAVLDMMRAFQREPAKTTAAAHSPWECESAVVIASSPAVAFRRRSRNVNDNQQTRKR
jgi:hypothetical protein